MADSSSASTYDPNDQDLSGNESDETYDPGDTDEERAKTELLASTHGSHGDSKPGSRDQVASVETPSGSKKANCAAVSLKKTPSKVHEISDSEDEGLSADQRHSRSTKAVSNITKKSSLFEPLETNASEKKYGDLAEPNLDGTGKNCGDPDVPNLGRADTVKVTEKTEAKKPCQYGLKCYRKNPSHFEEFSHPGEPDLKRKHSMEDDSENINNSAKKKKTDSMSTSQPAPSCSSGRGSTAGKLTGQSIVDQAEPYCFLLTKVTGIQPQHNNSGAVSLKDLLHASMGKLQKSAQFNYMFEVPWLVEQYPPEFRKCPLLLVHGFDRGNKAALDMDAAAFDHIRTCQARLEIMYGTHHTKMMFLLYDNGLRIVITTANLIQRDWYQKTQGVWVSPVFPRMSESSMAGDSSTHFKQDLVQYLTAYRARQLNEWIEIVKQHDMTKAKVYLISSVPGRHTGPTKHAFGHLKLRKVLENVGPSPSQVKSWPIVGQFSSIGSLGPTEQSWLCGEWYTSLSAAQGGGTALGGGGNRLKLIYPSKDNVRRSLEGYPAGGSLPYSINTAKKQTYLHNYLHQWVSEVHGRSRASPHIKSYCRASPNYQEMAWFLVTSANLSKAAWGALEKKASQLMIRSYEIGVLFLPDKYEKGKTSFKVLDKKQSASGCPCFPQPYDLPPVPYGKSDRPWIVDVPYVDKPDSHGNMWCPD